MIVYGGVSDIFVRERLRCVNLSEEYFFSLPYEYQKAILNAGLERIAKEKQKENGKKRMVLKQYEFETKTKEKVKVLLKRFK